MSRDIHGYGSDCNVLSDIRAVDDSPLHHTRPTMWTDPSDQYDEMSGYRALAGAVLTQLATDCRKAVRTDSRNVAAMLRTMANGAPLQLWCDALNMDADALVDAIVRHCTPMSAAAD